MTKEEVHKKLDELFSNNKSRNFMNHLIRSYFPMKKVNKVQKNPGTNVFKCAISDTLLVAIDDVLNNVDEESKGKVNTYLAASMEPPKKDADTITLEDGKKFAVGGEKTNTFISIEDYMFFHEWVVGKFLGGDKHISWLLKGVRKSDYFKGDGKSNHKGGSRKDSTPKGATYTLGDLGVLQELKKKMGNG